MVRYFVVFLLLLFDDVQIDSNWRGRGAALGPIGVVVQS